MHTTQFPAGTPVLKDDSVRIQGIRPEMVLVFLATSRIWGELGYPVTYTSINDGRHSLTSLHYAGSAVDIRTRDMRPQDAERGALLLRAALGRDFDVVLERDPPHLHVEYQPRRRE